VKYLPDAEDINETTSSRRDTAAHVHNNDYELRSSSVLYAIVVEDSEVQDRREVPGNEYVNRQDLVDGGVMYSQLAVADDGANVIVDSNVYYNV